MAVIEDSLRTGVAFNKQYARTLSQLTIDHDELLGIYHQIIKDVTGTDPDWLPYICLDPISAMATVNRGYSRENRVKLSRRLIKRFSIDSDVPDDFVSISIFNNLNSAFIWGSKKPDSDSDGRLESKYRETTEMVWECFRVFVKFAWNEATREEFIEAFDKVRSVKGAGLSKFTTALSWIDNERFFSLDKNNLSYLNKEKFKIKIDKGKMDGKAYLDFVDKVRAFADNRGESFFDLSFSAYEYCHGKDKDEAWWPSESEYSPGLTKEDWVKLLNDPSIFKKSYLGMIKSLMDMGGSASCAELSSEYGYSPTYYVRAASNMAKRIIKAGRCKPPAEEVNAKFWPAVFQGHKTDKWEQGSYTYKVRKELADATESCQELFNDIDPYYDKEKIASDFSNSHFPLNVIFYGPPGTGKTYLTAKRAVEIIDGEADEDYFDRYKELLSQKRISLVTFHPSYSYEEFIEGIRPETSGDTAEGISYKVEDGIFKTFCQRARDTMAVRMPEGVSAESTVWKVSLEGTGDNRTRSDCLENNYIRIGWSVYGANVTDETDFSVHGGKTVLDNFMNKMRVGDIVMSCYSNRTVDAVGIVTGDYYYDEKGGNYPRYRKVRWISKPGEPIDITPYNRGKLMTSASVYKMGISVPDALKIAGQSEKPASEQRFVFIIDEINRGNIARIFGELITLIEETKREGAEEELNVILPYSKESFSVPSNVYIIGTMNTADKSLVSLDSALRRRFKFFEMMTDYELVSDNVEGVNVRQMLEVINDRIEALYDRDHIIGHSYLMKDKVRTLKELEYAFKESIIPMLQEYFLDDMEKIGQVLAVSGNDSSNLFIDSVDYKTKFSGMPSKKYVLLDKDYTAEMFRSIYL